MKILLLGATGQLGRTFIASGGLAARGEMVAGSRTGEAMSTGRSVEADLADLPALTALLDAEKPDIIVNTAAYTAVDKAESDEANALLVNGKAPGVIGHWAANHDALVVHFSTDYVFSGDASSPYATDHATDPQSAYGRSKLAGEIALRDSGARHFIFRTAWVYAAVGHNFMKTMLRLGAERDVLRVVADQRGTPTSATIIVNGTLAAIDHYCAQEEVTALSGTYHLTANGHTSWHGFADAIFDEATTARVIDKRPIVEAIGTGDFPTPAARPAYSVLDTTSFTRTFHHPLPEWRDGLRDTLRALATS